MLVPQEEEMRRWRPPRPPGSGRLVGEPGDGAGGDAGGGDAAAEAAAAYPNKTIHGGDWGGGRPSR